MPFFFLQEHQKSYRSLKPQTFVQQRCIPATHPTHGCRNTSLLNECLTAITLFDAIQHPAFFHILCTPSRSLRGLSERYDNSLVVNLMHTFLTVRGKFETTRCKRVDVVLDVSVCLF